MRKRAFLVGLLAAVCLLTACDMRTVDEMYCLPKRPEAYDNLQSAIDEAMDGKEYSSPLSGENLQTVQMVDLDGDGEREYLLFAKSESDKPLQMLIFRREGEKYTLFQTVESNGTAFDLVEYVQMDGRGGMEIVVGRQLGGQLLRAISIYTCREGQVEQVMTTNYTKYLTCDLNEDGRGEVLVLRPGQTDTDKGVAELYSMDNGAVERSNEAPMSGPADRLKRILKGKIAGGTPGVFVGSAVDETAIITDVYALVDGVLTNVSLSHESGTSVQTLRNYYVYAEDIDQDGEVELPALIPMQPPEEATDYSQYLIRWYSMDSNGKEHGKMYTYHNFVNGWYLQLDAAWAQRICVVQRGSACQFFLWDSSFTKAESVFTVYTLTGQNREAQALEDNRFVLHREETAIYAAHLDVASGNLPMSREKLTESFNMIRLDWKTGEM